MKITQNLYSEDHHTLQKWKLFKNSNATTSSQSGNCSNGAMTVTPSESGDCWKPVFSKPSDPQSKNYPKSVLLSWPHPPKVEIIENQSFQEHHNHTKKETVHNQSFSRQTYPSKLKIVQNQSFQIWHTFWSHSSKLVLSRLPHPPKVKTVKNSPFRMTTPPRGNCLDLKKAMT